MNKSTILIVEDELLIAFDIKQILSEEGFESIVTVSSVEKAIEVIEEVNPILVVIDIKLNQDKDGVDLGQYLLQKDNIPYIYLTSYADKLTVERVNHTRPHGYIVKPFKPVDLATTVSIVLNNFKHKSIDVKRSDEEVQTPVPFKIKATIAYINDHLYDKIKIDELAELTPWKLHHFIRIFSQYIGQTPYQYILSKKVELAEALLTETDQPINEIAYDLGFHSYSNFCIAFRKVHLNETPEAFRLKKQASTS